eukprot:COSAG06_NODE_4317_length_4368_cov_3.983134_3_plen_48_part_00
MGGGILFTDSLDLRLAALMFAAILIFTLVRSPPQPLTVFASLSAAKP